ncbi:hypothetical protein V8E51_015992 [Hyaloscypha variabilis]
MHFSTLATIAALANTAFTFGTTTSTSIVTSPTGSCYTITTTNPPTCTSTATTCTIEDCIRLSTITQSCGCPSIYTSDVCITTCPPLGCQVSYYTFYLPCPTSPTFPTSPTSPASPSSSTSSSTIPPYNNSTMTTTVTTITTLTTCPATCTCSGQKTTWSGGQGPYSCTKKPSCVAQLPGGGTTTITGTTVVGQTGPTPTTSPGPTVVTGSSDGKKRSEVVGGGLLAGLLGVLAFF